MCVFLSVVLCSYNAYTGGYGSAILHILGAIVDMNESGAGLGATIVHTSGVMEWL